MKHGKLGWGIVGCGVIAPWHAESVRRCPDAELVAVCDVDEPKGKAFAEKYGVAFCKDHRELVAREDIDVISVCTPSGLHGEVTIAAAEAGVHVLCEKPLEVTKEKMDAMIKACRERGVKLGCLFQRRTYRASQMARKAVEEGKLGKLVLADAYLKYYRSQKYYDSAGWRGTWALDGGGALMNQGVHGVDLLLWLVGEPVVSAYAKADHLVRDIEVEDTAVALLTFRSGAYGVIEGTTSVNPGEPTRIMLHGKLGTITIEESKIVRWATTTGQDDLAEDREVEVEEGEEERAMQDPTAIGMAGHIALVKDMARAVIEDREPMIPGEDARKAVDLILAIYESARTGEEVRL